MPRIVDTRPLLTRLDECMASGAYPDFRAEALMRAYLRRRATLAAWDRAVAAVHAAYYADWTTTTPNAIADYCANVAILCSAGMVGPDDVAVGR